MRWYCKLGHPFEWGLYIDKSEDYWVLRCKGCNYTYGGRRLS